MTHLPNGPYRILYEGVFHTAGSGHPHRLLPHGVEDMTLALALHPVELLAGDLSGLEVGEYFAPCAYPLSHARDKGLGLLLTLRITKPNGTCSLVEGHVASCQAEVQPVHLPKIRQGLLSGQGAEQLQAPYLGRDISGGLWLLAGSEREADKDSAHEGQGKYDQDRPVGWVRPAGLPWARSREH